MKIKNFDSLATSATRKIALQIIEAGLSAIDTQTVIKKNVQLNGEELLLCGEKYNLSSTKNIFVIAIGKCALDAGLALESLLGDFLAGGIVLDVRDGQLKKMKLYKGTHPMPSDANVEATSEIIKRISHLNENDLVIFVISGGGSTLLCQPKNLNPAREAELLVSLNSAGANIKEVNTVRKHLSLARGGFLAEYLFPANAVSLIFSDVPGDNLEFVASGPTVRDTTSVADAQKIIDHYEVAKRRGHPISELIETPKDGKFFKNVKNILVATNKEALGAMARKARELSFLTEIVTSEFSGEAQKVGADIIKGLSSREKNIVLLYGGESTVTLKTKGGVGGRNQVLGLSALKFIAGDQLVAAVASDGRDNSDFAGVICDLIAKQKAEKLGLDIQKYLDNNDSYNFFKKTGDYILTSDTGSNVSDLIIAINE